MGVMSMYVRGVKFSYCNTCLTINPKLQVSVLYAPRRSLFSCHHSYDETNLWTEFSNQTAENSLCTTMWHNIWIINYQFAISKKTKMHRGPIYKACMNLNKWCSMRCMIIDKSLRKWVEFIKNTYLIKWKRESKKWLK